MRARDVIKFFIKEDSTWVDYTDGIINIDILRGLDEYLGPWQQSDVGQLSLTSRNTLLDPYVNIYVRVNREIRVTANDEPIFTGRISNIDVEYQPLGKPPIIRLNGIDFLGTMKRHILSDTFIKQRPQNWTVTSLLQDLGYSPLEIEGYSNPSRLQYGEYLEGGSIPSGTAAYDALTLRSGQNLGFIYADKNNAVYYWGNQENFPAGTAPYEQDSKIAFRSDGTGESYTEINLNDGFERIINQISFADGGGEWIAPAYTQFVPWSQTSITYTNTPSVALWGSSQFSLPCTSARIAGPTSSTDYQAVANAIFIESANPQREVQSITWDALRDVEVAKDIEIFDNIDVYHQIDALTIDRKYSVVGIRHSISESEWNITYNLRNFYYIQTSMPDPIVLVDNATGDTNHFFNFSIDFPAEQIQSVLWDFGDGTTSTDLTPSKKYSTTGTKNVTVTVTNVFNWVKTSAPLQVTVVGAAPTNTWTFTQSPTSWNTVDFTFTGIGANSYLWNFGDGTTSTQANPVHAFPAGSTYSVSLTCTNTFGSNTVTKPVTVTEPVDPPVETGSFAIRYLKIEQPLVTEGYPTAGSTQMWNDIAFLKANTSAGTNLALDKPVISVTNTKGYLTDFVYLGTIDTPCFDDYQKYQDWNHTISPLRLTTANTSTSVSGIRPEIDTDSGDCGKSQWSVIVDLGAPYNTIDQITVRGQWTPPAFTKPILNVYGSTDNITYTKIGEFNVNGLPGTSSRTLVTMTPTGAMPPNL